MNVKLCDIPSNFLFSKYSHQVIDTIESKIYKPLCPKPNMKPSENVCAVYFENKGVEFKNVARILSDPKIVKSFPTLSVTFLMSMVSYKLTPSLSMKFF